MTSAVRTLVRRLQAFVPQVRSGVTIFAYHLVEGATSTPVDLPAELFEAQLESLQGRVQSLDDALRQLDGVDTNWRMHSTQQEGNAAIAMAEDERHPSIGPVAAVLTFDDAYANFYEQVYPRLVARRLPAVLYVATGFIDREQPAPLRGTGELSPCTWQQLREMVASGLVTLGSHTVTHPSLTLVDPSQAEWELAASRARIEAMTRQPVRHFCYPRGLWNRQIEPLVRREYATATIGGGGSVQWPFNPHRLQRTSLRREFGPDLTPIVGKRVWLEERLANIVRRVRN